jgi:hypothetical protein
VRDRHAIMRILDREAIAVVLGVALLALLVTPRNASPLTSLGLLIAAPAAIALLRVRPVSSPDSRTWRTLGILAASVFVLCVGCVFAADPRVSYFGMVGQHSGGLMWLGLVLLAAVLVVFARPGDPGRVARAVALVGATLSVAAMIDAAGLMTSARFSTAAAGLLENSTSLAQVLVVALGCAVAWALCARGRARPIAWGCVAIVVSGPVMTSSRAAWVGIVLASTLAWAATVAARRLNVAPWALASLFSGLVILGLIVAWIVAGQSGDGATNWLVAVANQRSTIWTSAFAQARSHLAIGVGPEQFSAWATWSSRPGIDLTKTATYDPHNLALGWLLGAGIPGLAALIAAAFAGTRALYAVLDMRGHHRGLVAMAAGVGGLGVALMFAWTAPLAGLLAAIVTGTLLGAGVRQADVTASLSRYAVAAVAVATVAMIALSGPTSLRASAAEYAWARVAGQGVPDATIEAAAVETGDPTLAVLAVMQRLQSAQAAGEEATARSVLEDTASLESVLERAAPWNVDAAFELQDLAATRWGLLGAKEWPRVQTALKAGKAADPTSGLWDYVGAVRASAMGEPAAALQHAKAALGYPQTEPVRAWLQGVSGGK